MITTAHTGPVYTIPDSYRRTTTIASDRGAVYNTSELSDINITLLVGDKKITSPVTDTVHSETGARVFTCMGM